VRGVEGGGTREVSWLLGLFDVGVGGLSSLGGLGKDTSKALLLKDSPGGGVALPYENEGEGVSLFLKEEAVTKGAVGGREDVDVVQESLENFLCIFSFSHCVIGGVEEVECVVE
jgi:hypothetical protein